jgi:hypothetical protein
VLSTTKAKFTPEQFNSQGEIKFQEFKNFIHLDDILNKKLLVTDVAKRLGALDTSGNIIEFDTIDDALNQIGTFNKTQDDYVASIKRKGKKYFIDVEITNAENYLTQFKID